MNSVVIKILVGIAYGVIIGVLSLPLSEKLIRSRSEDPGDALALKRASGKALVIAAAVAASVGLVLTSDDYILAARNLVLLIPMLNIAIVDSLIRKIPNSLLLSMIIVQVAYLAYVCITESSNTLLIKAGLGFAFAFFAFTLPMLLRVPVGAGDVKYSAVIGGVIYLGCYLQSIALTGLFVFVVFIFLKATKRGGMKTLIPMGPFLSLGTVISMCFPLLDSLVAVENMF